MLQDDGYIQVITRRRGRCTEISCAGVTHHVTAGGLLPLIDSAQRVEQLQTEITAAVGSFTKHTLAADMRICKLSANIVACTENTECVSM